MWSRRAFVLGTGFTALPLLADDPMTTITVEVTDHKGDPVDRASVVVEFIAGRSVKKLGGKKRRKWELKTNQQGLAKMPPLPQGKIRVQVIADRYQTYGDFVEIYEEEKTVLVELNPPQPQYSAH